MPEVVCELFSRGEQKTATERTHLRSEITGRTLRLVPEPNGFANQTDVCV